MAQPLLTEHPVSEAESDLADRFRGALVGCLLGDALGSVLEGMSANDARLESRIARRRVEPLPWRYTDDTEMALGVARSLLACGRLDEAHLMETWSDAYVGLSLASAVAALGNGVTADESVPLALFAFLRGQPVFEDVVLTAARCGGDVDTIGAMAGALAGAFFGARQLPSLWLENAEGVGEAMALADGLHALWISRCAR